MKLCTKCGETKSRDAFSCYRRAKDGLYPHCRTCTSTRHRAWRAIPSNYAKERDAKAVEHYPNNTSYPADREARLAVYETARAQGVGVDHVVPLAADDVCGLHVSWNLQPMASSENFSKRAYWSQVDALAGISNFRVPPTLDVSQFFGY